MATPSNEHLSKGSALCPLPPFLSLFYPLSGHFTSFIHSSQTRESNRMAWFRKSVYGWLHFLLILLRWSWSARENELFKACRIIFFSGNIFLFSPSNICVSESSFGCFSGRILIGDAALHWSVFSLWTIMAGCAHWGILAILCFYGDALAWTYVFPFLSLFTWVDLSLSREAMTSEELICQWGLFIPGEDKESSWMSGQRIQAAMKVRKRALIVARSSLVVKPAARSLTSSWSCRALTSCAISVSQLGTD